MVRALPCHGRGCGFESRPLRHFLLLRNEVWRRKPACGFMLVSVCFLMALRISEGRKTTRSFMIAPACRIRIGWQRPPVRNHRSTEEPPFL